MARPEKFIALHLRFFENFCRLSDQWGALPYDDSGPRLSPVLLSPNTGNLLKMQSDFLAEVAFEVSVALGVEQEKKTDARIDFPDF